jgi:hypothetical protein
MAATATAAVQISLTAAVAGRKDRDDGRWPRCRPATAMTPWLRFQLLCAHIPPVRGNGAIALGVAAGAASLLLFPPAPPAAPPPLQERRER